MNFRGNINRAAFRRKIPILKQRENTPLTFEIAVKHYVQGHKIGGATFNKMLSAYVERFGVTKTTNIDIIAQSVSEKANVRYIEAHQFASWILWAEKLKKQE